MGLSPTDEAALRQIVAEEHLPLAELDWGSLEFTQACDRLQAQGRVATEWRREPGRILPVMVSTEMGRIALRVAHLDLSSGASRS
jgi:hypothetical protein